MPLIIEDGSCVAGADSFVTLAEADAHFASYGGFWTATDDARKEAALRRGALWLSTSFSWSGKKTCSVNMLSLPRAGLIDCDGNALPDNTIDPRFKLAQLLAASYELRYPNGLSPSIVLGKQILKEKVDVIEVTYMTADQQVAGSGGAISSQRPVLTQVNDLLRCFVTDGSRATSWPFVV
jgi:hypothetical protein